MTSPARLISVVVLPTSEGALRRALRALGRQSLAPAQFEVIVAGWTGPPTAGDSVERGLAIAAIPPAQSRGTAVSRALAQSTAPVVLLAPDVVELGPDALVTHADAHAGRRRLCLESVSWPAAHPTLFGRFMQALIEGPARPEDGDALPMRLRWHAPLSIGRDDCLAFGGLSEDARLDPVLLDELELRARRDGAGVIRLEPRGSVNRSVCDLAACAEEATAIGGALSALYDVHPASAAWTDLGTLLVMPVDADRLRTRAAELTDLERAWLASDPARAGADLALERVLQTLTDGWSEVLTGSLALGVQQTPAGHWPQDADRRRRWLAGARPSASQAGPAVRLGNPRQLHGLRVIPADSVVEPLIAAGRPAERLLRGPSGGWHLYVQLDHRPAPDDRPVAIAVEYLDSEHALWGLEYDSRDAGFRLASERPGAFKPAAPTVANTDSGEWRTAQFTLADWRFERGCHAADFRIIVLDTPGSGLVVHRVSIVLDTDEALPPDAAIVSDLSPTHFDTTDAPAATVVIPVHDRVGFTAACLRTLAGSAHAPFEVVVVDNGSTDGTTEFLQSCGGVRRIGRAHNDGFAVACNAGAAAARGRVVVFLNNDTLPLPGWLDALLAALAAHEHVAIAGAKLLFPTGQALVQHAGMTMDGVQPVHRGVFAPPAHPSVCRSRFVPAVTGACFAIATGEFRQAGGFDAGFQNGYEDVDLCLRLLTRRRFTYYCAQSVLFHYGAISAGRFAHEDRNRTRFLARWGSALPVLLGE